MVLGTQPPHRQRQQQLAGGQVVAETVQELPLDLPRRYQAELRPTVQVPVVPGVSGLEIVSREAEGDQVPGTKCHSRHSYIS